MIINIGLTIYYISLKRVIKFKYSYNEEEFFNKYEYFHNWTALNNYYVIAVPNIYGVNDRDKLIKNAKRSIKYFDFNDFNKVNYIKWCTDNKANA